jgi:hypothetical protein
VHVVVAVVHAVNALLACDKDCLSGEFYCAHHVCAHVITKDRLFGYARIHIICTSERNRAKSSITEQNRAHIRPPRLS